MEHPEHSAEKRNMKRLKGEVEMKQRQFLTQHVELKAASFRFCRMFHNYSAELIHIKGVESLNSHRSHCPSQVQVCSEVRWSCSVLSEAEEARSAAGNIPLIH